ncbi:MAG: FABP family protein [Microbacterium sp.]|uniref:FABP family protein n=1 Tax=Microbacterium sp. TaxID=51671 RepID=UPI001AC6F09C|nr:FABP family protein [Microbacterium sp.]MBN9155168.1 FABP family protein [Microbacterium sp.]MBN9181682.1 FABP family protein [Microbacterium sp.]
MIEIPVGLPADLAPLSWLIGVWEGTGVIDYDADGHRFAGEFAHRVSFSHDGGSFLNYSADAWLIQEDGTRAPLVSEIGYWRLSRPATDADAGPGLLPAVTSAAARTADDVEALRTASGGFEIEVSLVHSDGISELYLGEIRGPRIDIATDAVVRPAGAKNYAAATRMYGLVENHLLWAWDIAALGNELGAHASARLAKVD